MTNVNPKDQRRQRLFIEAIKSAADLMEGCEQLGVPRTDITRVFARIGRLAAKEGINLGALLDAHADQMTAFVDALLKGDAALVDAVLPKKK
jgi:hypothetical protein